MEFPRQEYWSGLPFPAPRGASQPRDRTCFSCISCIGRWILHHCTTWEVLGDYIGANAVRAERDKIIQVSSWERHNLTWSTLKDKEEFHKQCCDGIQGKASSLRKGVPSTDGPGWTWLKRPRRIISLRPKKRLVRGLAGSRLRQSSIRTEAVLPPLLHEFCVCPYCPGSRCLGKHHMVCLCTWVASFLSSAETQKEAEGEPVILSTKDCWVPWTHSLLMPLVLKGQRRKRPRFQAQRWSRRGPGEGLCFFSLIHLSKWPSCRKLL